VLERSVFTLAPEGVHVDSYRAAEALEAGSVPVVSCDTYFEALWVLLHPPLPIYRRPCCFPS
jgi:hypothetical protein